MKILIANLGSTSFKYSLFDMDGEKVLARGRVERIGEAASPCSAEVSGVKREMTVAVSDHSVAVRQCLSQLTEPGFGPIKDTAEVAAIGFKAIHAFGFTGVHRVDTKLIDTMEEVNEMFPAHNPPYVAAMRILADKLPDIPLVAAFETGFHQTIPDRNRHYGVPFEWAEKYDVVRFGFHGASHRYISVRTAEISPLPASQLRVISMHLGGSSSLCAIRGGKSVAASMGVSTQSGLFHGSRVGDFDPFVIPYLMRKLGKSQEEILSILAKQSGLVGLSGVSADLRDVMNAADQGNRRAKLALEVLVGDIRRYLGAFLVELGGADMIVFTGGIGEHNKRIRKEVCQDLSALGIVLDEKKNEGATGAETALHSAESTTQIWVIPTNEEIIVARQVLGCLSQK